MCRNFHDKLRSGEISQSDALFEFQKNLEQDMESLASAESLMVQVELIDMRRRRFHYFATGKEALQFNRRFADRPGAQKSQHWIGRIERQSQKHFQ